MEEAVFHERGSCLSRKRKTKILSWEAMALKPQRI